MTAALHEQIADDLRRQIHSGDLAVGAPLPSESRLCAQWDTSRGPVRQALGTLRAEGLITGGRGKPPVVRSASLGQPFDTLLSYSAWAHSIGRTPGQHTIELARRRADEATAVELEVSPGEQVVQVLRLRLLDDQRTMLERSTFVDEVGRRLFDFDCDSGSLWAYLQGEGADFQTASHTIDAVAADLVDSENLDVPIGSPLLRQRRWARNSQGVVVEYSDDRYRPDLVSFTLDNALDARTALMRQTTTEIP